jgi:pimeloyl-ACP methyl ester carboxylesterase
MAFRAPQPPGRLIDVGGFRLHAHAVGEGPVIVFEAALGGSSISWSLVAPEVATFARAFAYDRAGFGWSDAGPLPRTAGRVADELRVLLDRAGEKPPYVLVGHSFGGFVMRIFARRHAADTAGLVFADTAHPEDWLVPSPREQERIDRGTRLCRHGVVASRYGLARIVAAMVGSGALAPARAVVGWFTRGDFGAADEDILAPMWKLPPEVRRPLRYFWTQAKFYEALGSQIEAITLSAREAVEAAQGGYGDVPLVTISATDPGDHRMRQQTALVAQSTRGQHWIAQTSSHWVPLDEPAIVIRAIRDVIESRSPRHRAGETPAAKPGAPEPGV